MATKKKFIQKAIKREGALTADAKASGKSINAEAESNKTSGTDLQKKQANFYLNVLKPANQRRRAKKTLMR